MSQQPVILLAFANSEDAHLSMLKRESRNVNQALEALEDKNLIKVSREESASIDEVFHNFNRFRGRIAVFHYGGHADGAGLHLEEQNANAAGLAKQLAEEPNLKLVFLNGCSTLGQVEYLMKLGVRAVIATSTAIGDTRAMEFSEHFYRALANFNSIKDSFNFAVNFLKTKYGRMAEPTIKTHRGLKLRRGDDDLEEIPWGLYLNKSKDETGDEGDSFEETAHKDILEWSLPTQFLSVSSRPSEEEEFKTNDYIYMVADEMALYNKSMAEELYDENGEWKIDDREALLKIIGNFPWPIGSQIRRLVSNDDELKKPTITRLKQIISTYVVTGQLLNYILLAQIWEERRSKQYIPKTYVLNSLTMNAESFGHYDYFSSIKQVLQELKEAGHQLFAPEFDEIRKGMEAKESLYDAYLYLESLRSRISANQNLASDIWQICANAEHALYEFLKKAAFLAKYQMVTVRNITITNPRHKDASFNHYIGKLHATAGDLLNLERKPITFDVFTDSRSVLLIKGLDDVSTYLNLSPFVVDKNAFGDAKSPATDLYMYAYQENDEYNYLISQHNIYKALSDSSDRIHTGMEEKNEVQTKSRRGRGRRGRGDGVAKKPYAVLKEQFELFKADLSN